ncbi:MAG: hypothetical protein ACU0A5_14830 [Salipiger marinus]|uniref:hypothetical protein n=1 Tax=Salipiger marinus TaxID=555512 RepID=UPI0040599FD4
MNDEDSATSFQRVVSSASRSLEARPDEPTDKRDALIEELQEELERVKDARREDAFAFIIICILLFNIVFFTVMPTSGGPLALLILELLILVPLAQKMGMENVVQIISRVLDRVSSQSSGE